MRKILSTCALCLALAAPAANAGILTYSFDISGLASEGSFGANFPTLTHSFGTAGTVTSVLFNINATMTEPSWSEELQIAINTVDDQGYDADINMENWGGLNDSNPIAASGVLAANSLSSDGDVFLTLYESFNDATPNPDARYGQGSIVTVEFTTLAVEVPEPTSGMLFGVSLLALFAVIRRRA